MNTVLGRENGLAARLFAILFASMFISFIAATSLAAYVSWTAYEGDAEERLTAQLEKKRGRKQAQRYRQYADWLSAERGKPSVMHSVRI